MARSRKFIVHKSGKKRRAKAKPLRFPDFSKIERYRYEVSPEQDEIDRILGQGKYRKN